MKRVLSSGVVAALLLIPAAGASAHNPVVDIGCRQGVPIVRTAMSNFNDSGDNRIRLYIDGALRFDRTFPSAFRSTSTLGSGYVSHRVRVIVKAWDDPDGSKGYSRTFRLVAPACKGREHVAGRAALYGPYLDPQYYARFWAGSAACTFRWTRVDGGVTKVITRTVAAGRSQSTKLKHADGGTTQTIRGCGVSITKVTAPGGNYGAP